ncbi:MAG: hypothetical protein NWE89_04020 [Candidatus Bathyarchaeota archaeon]|nr:hypothetical protein [Candidatus Bathyarchaeota archaeon]
MRIAVFADDLTGALDTGVQFRNWGFTVQVTDDPETSKAKVTVINTDTRNSSPEEAYRKTYQAAKKAIHSDLIYKKTDSTLRGNPGAELQAILDATGVKTAIITPAYPPTLRRVKKGYLYVGDIPLDQTEYASEHSHKISYIPDIIKTQTTTPVTHLETVDEIRRHSGILVVDSETEADLKKIAGASINYKVLGGSAGLAAAIAEVLVDPPPVLTVLGSTRTTTQQQAEVLKHRLQASLILIDTEEALCQRPQTEAYRKASEALRSRVDTIITSAPNPEAVQRTVKHAEALGLTPEETELRITGALAELTKQLLENQKTSGLTLSGGATSLAVCDALGVTSISIEEEILPGIPLLRLDHINAVTKAGGFGQQDALVQATQHLKRRYR